MRQKALLMIFLLGLLTNFASAQEVFSETFDGGIPADWSVIDNNSDSKTWVAYSNAGYDDSFSVKGADYAIHDDYLVMPQVAVQDGMILKFWVKNQYSWSKPDLSVLASATTAEATSFTIELANYTSIGVSWTECEIVLTDNASVSAGDNIYVAFYSNSTSNVYYNFIDNVKLQVPLDNDLVAQSAQAIPAISIAGEELSLTADIFNYGDNEQTNVSVDVQIDGSTVGAGTIASIASKATETASTSWTATEGNHTLSVIVPDDDYNANNSYSTDFYVFPADAIIEDFEGATWPPAGWNEGGTGWQSQIYGVYEGSKCAYISTSGTHRLITPKLTISNGDKIAFYAKAASTNNIKLQYSSDLSTWTDVPNGTIDLSDQYNDYNVDLSDLAGENYFIAFTYSLSNVGVYVDNVAISASQAQEVPLAAQNPTPTDAATGMLQDASLEWEANPAGGVPAGYKLYIGTDGSGTATPVNIENGAEQSETTYSFSSALAYETTYYWQIVPTNAIGDATNCPIWSFTTVDDPTQPIPFLESFNAVTAYSVPTNWTATNYTVKAQGADNSNSISANMASYPASAEFVTCPIGALGTNGNQIQFDYRICEQTYSNYPQDATTLGASDKIEVQVSADGGVTYETVYTINESTHTSSLDFVKKTIELDPAYNGEIIQVQFVNTWGVGSYTVDVDNLTVRETPSNPIFAVSATALDFGQIPVGLTSSKSITITNDGGGTLDIADGDIAINGTNAAAFELGAISYPIALAANESVSINVNALNTSSGEKAATLDISHNAAKGTSQVALSASVYEPYTNYTSNFDNETIDEIPAQWTKITDGVGMVYIGEDGFSVNSHSEPQFLAINNSGQTSGNLIAVLPAVNFDASHLEFWAKATAAAQELSVGTLADPNDPTTYTEFTTLTLNSTYEKFDVDFSTYTGVDMFIGLKHSVNTTYKPFYIDDLVWEPIPVNPICTVSPAELSWDISPIDGAYTKTISIQNTGVGTLSIVDGDILIAGTNANEFSVVDVTYPIELAADEALDVSVVFEPTAEGSREALLTIHHNGENTAQEVALTGEGFGGIIEDFNESLGSFPSEGWTADAGWTSQSFDTHEGAGAGRFNPSSEATNRRLVTPKLFVQNGDQLSFYLKKTYKTPTLAIQYSENATDWTLVESIAVADAEYTQHTVDLGSIPEGNVFIAFSVTSEALSNFYIDYITAPQLAVEAPVAAISPNPEHQVLDVDPNIMLAWEANTAGVSPSSYKVFVGTDGDGTTTPTNLVNGTEQTEASYTFASALDYETTYYWQIVPSNETGDATDCPIWSFTTVADPTMPIPFSQNFDAINAGEIPENWSAQAFSVNETNGVEGSPSLSVYMWSGTSSAQVTTCPVGPLSSTENQIKFDYRICDYAYSSYPQNATSLGANDKVQVQVASIGGSFETIYTIDQSTHVESLDFATITLDLDVAYNDQNIKVKLLSSWGAGEYLVDIDNIVIREKETNPVFLASAQEINFANTPVGYENVQSITITNDGGGALEFAPEDISITGTNADVFSVVDVNSSVSLQSGESTVLSVQCVPVEEGALSATLEIIHNGLASPATISLMADAYEPFINYSQNFDATPVDEIPEKWNKIADGAGLVYVADNASSGNAQSTPNSLIVANYSQTSGSLMAVMPAVNFNNSHLKFYAKADYTGQSLSIGTLSDPTDPLTYVEFTTVTVNDSYAEYEVDFSNYSGTNMFIAFSHNLGGSNNAYYIDNVLWEPIPVDPVCSVDPTTLHWNLATIDQSYNNTISVTNSGAGTLVITEEQVVFAGAHATDFSVDATFPIELEAQETTEITVSFTPNASGLREASMTINHNGTNDPVAIALSGNGYAGIIQDFNDAATVFPPVDWSANEAWKSQGFSTHEGAGAAWFNPQTSVTNHRLTTPMLHIASGDELSFYLKNANDNAQLKIEYSTDTVSEQWNTLQTITLTETEYTQYTIDLSSIEGQDVYLAFSGTADAYASFYLDYVVGPALADKYAIDFLVTDVETGDPIEGAEVIVYDNSVLTNSSGQAQLELNNGTYNYSVQATGYNDFVDAFSVSGASNTVTAEMVGADMYLVTFAVTDVSTIPIENATISIDGQELTTDTDGLASLFLQTAEYSYTITADGYLSLDNTVSVNNEDVTINKQLQAVYSVTFTVIDGAGQPVQEAYITIDGDFITTDENGVGVIALVNGTYGYSVSKANYENTESQVVVDGGDVDEPVTLMKFQPVTFSVTDGESAVSGAEVVINSTTLVTDEAGIATINLLDGEYTYTVSHDGYETYNSAVTVQGAAVPVSVELVAISVPEYTVTFTVTDGESAVSGAEVVINSTTLVTSDAGVATLALPDGEYAYVVSKDGYETYNSSITVQSEAITVPVELEPVNVPEYTITFTVTDGESAVSGAEVVINSTTLVTDDAGVATLALPDGEYAYTVSKDGYETYNSAITVQSEAITVPVELEPVNVPEYTITFTVTDGESAVSGAEVVINSTTLVTSDAGVATIALPDGEYAYTVSKDGYETYNSAVTVQGAAVPVSVELQAIGVPEYTVTFTVTDGESAVSGAEVVINSTTLVTSDAGVATLALPDGEYAYTVSKDGYETYNSAVTVQGAAVPVSVELQAIGVPEYTVTFTVTDGESAVSGAEVVINSTTLVTSDAGVATLALPDGEYAYTVSKDGYETYNSAVTVQGAAVPVSIELQAIGVPEYTVTFTVTDGESAVIGAEVVLNSTTLVTDEAGVATIVLPNGEYDFTVSKDGYADYPSSVLVDGADEGLNISLLGTSSIELEFSLYPNPTSGLIHIDGDGFFSVSIVSVSGREVFADKINGSTVINLSQFSSGVYFVFLRNENTIIKEKIVLQ